MPVIMFGLFWLLVLGGAFYLAARLVRALEQRNGVVPTQDLDMLKRMQQLEDTLERQTVELQQLTENQQFLESVLRGRVEKGSREG
jgi:hypothetical protein